MRKVSIVLMIVFCAVTCCFAQEEGLLLDDFEGMISGGPTGTVDFGAGNGSDVQVSASGDIQHGGKQSLKVVYDVANGGYMYVAKGSGLDAKNAAWSAKVEDIDWEKYNTLSFYMFGNDSKIKVAVDIKDNGSEIWRFIVSDDFKGWKQLTCPLKEFFCRGDWQPESADKNAELDFPLKSYQFEALPEGKGTLYFDDVELVSQ